MGKDTGKARLNVAEIFECAGVEMFVYCLNTRRFRAVDTKRTKLSPSIHIKEGKNIYSSIY